MATMTERDTIGRFAATQHTDPEVGLDLHEAYLEDTEPADFDIDEFHNLNDSDDPPHTENDIVSWSTQERLAHEEQDIAAYFDRAEPAHLTGVSHVGFDGDSTPF